jgi:hypothetical protein
MSVQDDLQNLRFLPISFSVCVNFLSESLKGLKNGCDGSTNASHHYPRDSGAGQMHGTGQPAVEYSTDVTGGVRGDVNDRVDTGEEHVATAVAAREEGCGIKSPEKRNPFGEEIDKLVLRSRYFRTVEKPRKSIVQH